jgi:hypothetical protein
MSSAKTCGSCSVCCQALTFYLGGALKPSGVCCTHARPPSGCAVYQSRETVCRAYFCGWYHLPSLGGDWRPDRSGVLISFREGPAPDGRSGGIEFHLTASPEVIFWPPLVRYIATLLVDQDPVFLSLPGEAGFQSPWVYLNTIGPLQQAIARRDFAAVTGALRQALQVCRDYPKTALPPGLHSA